MAQQPGHATCEEHHRDPLCLRETQCQYGVHADELDEKVQKLSNHRGKAVLVNLWATWCPPCIAELPLLDEIVRDYGPRGLVVLGIAGDDDAARVREFVVKHSPAFKVLLDPGGTVGTQYGITGYPESFLVDRDGKLVAKFVGPLPSDSGRLAQSVSSLLDAVLTSSPG